MVAKTKKTPCPWIGEGFCKTQSLQFVEFYTVFENNTTLSSDVDMLKPGLMWLSEKCNRWRILLHEKEHSLCVSEYNDIIKEKTQKDAFWVNNRSCPADGGDAVKKRETRTKEQRERKRFNRTKCKTPHTHSGQFSPHSPHFRAAGSPLGCFPDISNMLLPQGPCGCCSRCLEPTSSRILCTSYPHFLPMSAPFLLPCLGGLPWLLSVK